MHALYVVLVAAAALVVSAPTAAATPAVEEYSLDLPGDEEPAPEPAAPAPAPAPAPYVPPPVATPEFVPTAPVIVEPPEPKPRDVAASRRDVLFALPASARVSPAARGGGNPGDGSGAAPIVLGSLAAAGAGCILLTFWRLRRFSRRGAAPRVRAPARSTAGQVS